MDAIARQIAAETNTDVTAEAEAAKALQDALRSGDIDRLPKAKLLLGNVFPHVHDYLVAQQEARSRGPHAALRTWLRAIPADVAAVIAIRATLRLILGGNIRVSDTQFGATLQRIACGIAREWVQEIQIRQAEQVNPAYYQAAMRGLEEANVSSRKHISMTVSRVIRNTLDGLYDNPLNETELLHLGKHGLQGCLEAGLVEVYRTTGSQGHIAVYRLPEAVEAFLGDKRAAIIMAKGTNTPMNAPPLDWLALTGGGYYTERRQLRYPLVNYRKTVRRQHTKAFHEACQPAQMAQVYQYVNYLQSMAFQVDLDVYSLVERVWGAGGGAMGMPRTTPPPKPEFPFGEGWDKAQASEADLLVFREWKRRTTRWHEECRKHQSVVWEMYHFVKHVREQRGERLYYPVFLDSRGRLYYRASPNPQGTDSAKAVLHFADKKALGKRGVFWLKVHIANCFGVDRAKFAQRAAWTDEHWERLRGSLGRPEESAVYEEADSPLCAYAAILELHKAIASGNPETFLSGLPIHMDATCSGLQHFSAILRDPVGGAFTNLISGGDEKADIYRQVATLVKRMVDADAAAGCPLGQRWTGIEITRNLAKKPVMTYVYGATLSTVAAGVVDYLDEIGYKDPDVALHKLGFYLAKLMFRAVEETVPAAAAAMRFLRDLMRQVPQDQPVTFCTAMGFPVVHDYRDEERTRVRVRSCDMEYVVMYRKLDKVKPQRMQNAISPNFVHSLDGTHLGMTALRMQAGGRSMVCIHDSFGTHPCDVDAMHSDIREAFIAMYQRDFLADLANQLAVNVTYPSTGTLDLNVVRDSEFFFC